MALPSQVSKPRATYHYFTNMQNLLLAAGTACFLGKHLVSFLGKDCANYPCLEKIGLCTRDYFAFYDFSSALSSAHSLVSVLVDGAAVLKGTETQANSRTRRHGDMPREDNRYAPIPAWMAYRTALAVCKAVSSILLVHEALKHIGALSESYSPTIRAIGGGLGAVGFIIDIIDTERAIRAHEKDVHDGAIPSDGKIASTAPKGQPRAVNPGDEVLHRRVVQGSRRYDKAFKALIVGVKIMGVIRALNMIESAGLMGRVSQFATDHADNIYGMLFTAMSVIGGVQHVRFGATIQQLQERNVNKE